MDKLREWLKVTNKPIADLAAEIGVSENTIRNWLAGRNCPGGLALRRLADRTDIPLEDLVPRDVA